MSNIEAHAGGLGRKNLLSLRVTRAKSLFYELLLMGMGFKARETNLFLLGWSFIKGEGIISQFLSEMYLWVITYVDRSSFRIFIIVKNFKVSDKPEFWCWILNFLFLHKNIIFYKKGNFIEIPGPRFLWKNKFKANGYT